MIPFMLSWNMLKHVQAQLTPARYRQLRIEVARQNTTLQKAVSSAIDLWLEQAGRADAGERRSRLTRIRGLLARWQPERTLSEELLAERRREAARENAS